jgi:hypothetical protein
LNKCFTQALNGSSFEFFLNKILINISNYKILIKYFKKPTFRVLPLNRIKILSFFFKKKKKKKQQIETNQPPFMTFQSALEIVLDVFG